MKITNANYFKKDKYLSNSKITDFLKDKYFFHRKHVIGDIVQETTIPMVLGSAVDTWLTKGEMSFRRDYNVVKARSEKNGDLRWQINETMYHQIVNMCENVQKTDAYKALGDFKTQQVIQYDMKIGLFSGIKGIPDWYKIEGDKCIIVDLKTSNTADPNKYHYHCLDYNYYRQAACYSHIIQLNNPEIELQFEYRHLVVEKDSDDINNVYTFILSNDRVEMEKQNLIDNILPAIAAEKKFLKHNCNWNNPTVIGEVFTD